MMRAWLRPLLGAVLTGLLAALLLAALYQIPTRHTVDIGGADGGYVRGFYNPERADAPAAAGRSYLQGAESARWSRESSYLVFPQAGQPAELRLRWRGWRSSQTTPVQVRVVLVGGGELARFTLDDRWSEATIPVRGGLLKPSDVAIALESTTTTLDDGRDVGVLLDSVTYTVGPAPITPYPFQLLYGALAGGLLFLALALWRGGVPDWRPVALALALLGLLFLLLFRLQPPLIPYPLRWLLLLIDGGLVGLLALLLAPRLARKPALLEAALVLAGLAWTAWVWSKSSQHLVLSVPGVEKDFSVFARRSSSWADVLSADGFYNLGYPLLLRLVRPFVHDNPFLAGRLIALGAAVIVLLVTWRLGRARWGRAAGLLAALALALSPLFVEYALYLGTDMPFAAAALLSLWPLLRRPTPMTKDAALAGLGAGIAFTLRHPGLLLLPLAALYVVLYGRNTAVPLRRMLAALLGAFLLAAGAQIVINTAQTGQPLYNQQAKNIWLAVYGNTEWTNWDEERNDITLRELLARDPARMLSNWWGNVQAFTGTGGARSEEFERAVQLRLLAWPLNLLALAGLAGWLLRRDRAGLALLGWSALYLSVVALSFLLPRFALPLAPIYALGAGWALARIASWPGALWSRQRERALAAVTLLAFLLTYGQTAAGAGAVLAAQIPGELAMAQAIAALPEGQPVLAHVQPRTFLAKYSAVAHRLRSWSGTAASDADAHSAGAEFVIWEGSPPDGWRGEPLARAGSLTLYKLP